MLIAVHASAVFDAVIKATDAGVTPSRMRMNSPRICLRAPQIQSNAGSLTLIGWMWEMV
jgi:hypothetical protein